MRIVVTGASGNLGTALLVALGAAGHDVLGISRRRPPHRPPYDRAQWSTVDVGSPDARAQLTARFTGADAVVHLAWAITSTHDRERMRAVNVEGTRAVAQAAATAGVQHLVHASSIGAYSPGPGQVVDENWPVDGIPSSSYSVDKAAAERVVAEVADDLVVTRMRPSLIFQPAAASAIARYFLGPLFPRSLLHPAGLRVAPFPDQLAFQAVHAEDVAAAITLALRERVPGALNVAAPPLIDRSVWRRTFGGVGPPAPTWIIRTAAAATWRGRLQPTEPGWIDLARQVPVLDTGRLESLGWRAQHQADAVLHRFLEAMARGAGRPGPVLHRGRVA